MKHLILYPDCFEIVQDSLVTHRILKDEDGEKVLASLREEGVTEEEAEHSVVVADCHPNTNWQIPFKDMESK